MELLIKKKRKEVKRKTTEVELNRFVRANIFMIKMMTRSGCILITVYFDQPLLAVLSG